ncbi:glycosyltransferase [Maritimibacter sp. DP1N21-5]|uniref:glycosyltransferase n=1 Tax=Maritimibacter sp. DP1N21-5 TaxID=2836867 RepID=UPI001C44AA10|nr:glycosyltransferase [Maritimibacter sp. DP1N21-5]MBV7410450.1 glycosyltransferase [Maritimibacter sp. DP1N21-5]
MRLDPLPPLDTAARVPEAEVRVLFPERAGPLGAGTSREAPTRGRTLGQILLDQKSITRDDLSTALDLQARSGRPLSEVLVANGLAEETAVYGALAIQSGLGRIDLQCNPPDVRLIDEMGVETCLRLATVPLRRIGTQVVLATARPDRPNAITTALPAGWNAQRLVVATPSEVETSIVRRRALTLAERAETRVPPGESCRTQRMVRSRLVLAGITVILTMATLAAPVAVLSVAMSLAVLTLFANSALKVVAAAVMVDGDRPGGALPDERTPPYANDLHDAPVVSILVPLFRERRIAARLIKRLSLLAYPRELLDICLVVEADDRTTQDTLAATMLPPWMRVIEVPRGGIKTKPRALNYALDFARGSIIGIYDAEDAPEPDQIVKIVRRFRDASPWVVCLQGALDYYNARTNWLSRSFTVEYAAWFRVVLPGLERLGLVLPLGGTTLFFRRDALEALGRWDAHNVTEDADLGIRLARHGYRTEMVDTVTLEEANCRFWPWVKQRSRWIKGYAITWGVHMRNPLALLDQLGPRKFIGVQVLFLGSLAQALLAPVLWSFWVVAFGLAHPLHSVMAPWLFLALGGLFVAAEILTMIVNIAGLVARERRARGRDGRGGRFLLPFVPLMHLYYPLATIAALKGVAEVFFKPFYWDKTQHGIADETPEARRLTGHDAPVTPADCRA